MKRTLEVLGRNSRSHAVNILFRGRLKISGRRENLYKANVEVLHKMLLDYLPRRAYYMLFARISSELYYRDLDD